MFKARPAGVSESFDNVAPSFLEERGALSAASARFAACNPASMTAFVAASADGDEEVWVGNVSLALFQAAMLRS